MSSIAETVSGSYIKNWCVEWCGHMLNLFPWYKYTLLSLQAAKMETNRQFLNSTITWLIPLIDFVSCSRHESFRSHTEEISGWCVYMHLCIRSVVCNFCLYSIESRTIYLSWINECYVYYVYRWMCRWCYFTQLPYQIHCSFIIFGIKFGR